MKNKDQSIEVIRGITIVLVVMGHVIGIDGDGGMKVADDSLLRYFYQLFENIRMPLFTVISGWVYSLNPVKINSLKSFILKKARRLLLPLIFVGTGYFLLRYLIPGTNVKEPLNNIWRIYLFPYTIYWYLPALFLVFLAVSGMERMGCLNKFKTWGIMLIASTVVYLFLVKLIIPESFPNFFAFKNGLYLLPFFLIGLGSNRFKEQVYGGHHRTKIYLVGLVAGVIIQQLYYFFPDLFGFYEKFRLNLFIGMISTIYIMTLKLKSKAFVLLAKYAYSIYLFHGFYTAGGRILMLKLGITSDLVLFLFCTILAIGAPIVMDRILNLWRITRLLFLGKNYSPLSVRRNVS